MEISVKQFPSPKQQTETYNKYIRMGREVINNSLNVYYAYYKYDQNKQFLKKLSEDIDVLIIEKRELENALENKIKREKVVIRKSIKKKNGADMSANLDYKLKLLDDQLTDLKLLNLAYIDNHHYWRQLIKVMSMCKALKKLKEAE
jgi:hypothetical protein